MIDAIERVSCGYCGEPVTQAAKRGPRPRLYCNDVCRQLAYRKRQHEQAQEALRQRWADYLPGTQELLEDIMQTHGEALASHIVDAISDELSTRGTRIAELERQVKDLQAGQISAELVRRTTRRKKPPKPLPLPSDLVYWRHFANLHAVPQNEVMRAMQAGFVHCMKGDWMVESGYPITEALDEKGRRDFWIQFHASDKFRNCDTCPHSIVNSVLVYGKKESE